MPKKSALDIWTAVALALPDGDYTPRKPLHVLEGEAIDLAKHVARHWKSERDPASGKVLPGLETAGKKLPASIGDDLLSLQQALRESQQAYLLAGSAKVAGDAQLARARALLGDITATIEWALDDEEETDDDKHLATVKQQHATDPESADALAGSLDDYVALGRDVSADIDGLGGFDLARLDEAEALANELRLLPERAASNEADAESARAKTLRDRIAFLLFKKLGLVRDATAFVFRDRPDIIKEAASAHDRKRRAAARRAAKKRQGQQGGEGGGGGLRGRNQPSQGLPAKAPTRRLDTDGEETGAVQRSQATTPLAERDGVQVVATGELGERTT